MCNYIDEYIGCYEKTESVKIRGRMLDASWILKIKHAFHIWEMERKEVDIRRNEGEDFHPHLNIALKGFRFYHTASTSDQIDSKYIHRPKFEEKLKNWLTEESGHGVYLVTGYRGTGKSSLVGAVIRDLKQESGASNQRERNKFKFSFIFKRNPLWLKIKGKQIEKNRGKKYVDVCINIGQENINEIDFLRVLAKTLRDKLVAAVRWGASRWSWYIIVSELKRLQAIVGLFVGGVIALLLEFRNEYPGHCIFSGILFAIFMFAMMLFACYIGGALGQVRMILHLERLCKNLYAVTRYERGIEGGGIFKGIISKAREVPPATAQEIEYELINILNIAKKHFSIIIVLDELDKFDKVNSGEVEGQDLGEGEDVLKQSGQYVASQIRRQRVLAMIANMKYFLSTAPAYFIFIGGRELYEAAMADISDREFAIGNLFNGILQIDSFYTRKGLSDAIDLAEEFVCRQIDKEAYDLGELYEKQCVNQEQLVFLYRFICYLAFISHGSPKKIAVFFEKYVRSPKYLRAHQNSDIESSDALWYLSFRDHQQMKINFVHYLAFPILQNIMNRSAIFGDKLRVAESFIFAHIVKLHNGGFSWRNIEQIPEIMAINREPEVREYIQAILMNMQQGRIKQIVCGLYAYKFPLKLAEEISYFSKMSDELSALLNFSIGELQPIKEHYFALLDKLQTNVEREKGQGMKLHMCEHVYAEASIRHALGDIYMQEENFSAAIRQFARCVELTTPLLIKPTVKDHRQLQNYVLFYYRTMLKLGLAHEKRHTDNSAYVVYGDLLRVLFEVREDVVAPLFRDNRGLHLGILAQLYVVERMGTTGVTCAHITESIERFRALYQFRDGVTSLCNPIVKADFYRKLGDIMFYKNFECLEQGYSAIWAYEEGIEVLLKGRGLQGGDFWRKIYNYIDMQHSAIIGSHVGEKVWVYSLAILCESLGHAYIGTSRLEELESESVQMAWLASTIRGGKIPVLRVSRLRTRKRRQYWLLRIGKTGVFTKGLYCYWVAAKLYEVASENQATGRCYKYLLSAGELYVKRYYRKNGISLSEGYVLTEILLMANFIIGRLLMGTYRSYEYVNVLEKDWLDRYLLRECAVGDKLNIPNLSVKTDVEEGAYAYFQLLIAYSNIAAKGYWVQVRKDLFRVLLQVIKTDVASNATLMTLINRHRLILCIYKCYLFDLLGKHGVNARSVPSDIFSTEVKDFIEGRNGVHLSNFVIAIGGWKIWKKFCGIKNNEFKARKGTYKLGCNAVGLREVGINKYRFEVLNSILPDAIRRSDEIMKWMVGPLQVTTLFNHTFQGNVYNDYAIFLKLYRQLGTYAKIHGISDFDDVFNSKKKEPKYANEDYLAERALQSYGKAQECHRQGQAYQDLIQQLYFLEDDFNNDTIQFYLATERINLPQTKKKEQELRKASEKRTDYYRLESYESPIASV